MTMTDYMKKRIEMKEKTDALIAEHKDKKHYLKMTLKELQNEHQDILSANTRLNFEIDKLEKDINELIEEVRWFRSRYMANWIKKYGRNI